MSTSTRISNATNHVLKIKVDNDHYDWDLTSVQAGGQYSMYVDFNATYREYIVRVDAPGLAKLIVSSDDLCDNQCITIKEEGGKLNMEMDRRISQIPPRDPPDQTSTKSTWIPAWMSRSKQQIVRLLRLR